MKMLTFQKCLFLIRNKNTVSVSVFEEIKIYRSSASKPRNWVFNFFKLEEADSAHNQDSLETQVCKEPGSCLANTDRNVAALLTEAACVAAWFHFKHK